MPATANDLLVTAAIPSDSLVTTAKSLDALANSPILKAVTLSKSPVAYWRLNEVSGTTFADSSGNGLTANMIGTGTLLAAESLLAGDPASKSPQFNGSGNVSAANVPDLGASGWSASCWALSTLLAANQDPLVMSIKVSGIVRSGQFLMTAGNKFQFNCGAFAITFSGFLPNDGAVHHWLVTWDATGSGLLSMYIDGVMRASGGSGNTIIGNGPFTAGIAGNSGGGNRVTGSVADVSIYTHTLSVADVSDIYLAGANAIGALATSADKEL